MIILQLSLLPAFSMAENDGGDFVNDFGQEFSLSMYNLKELFLQQNDGGLDIPGLFAIAFSCLGIVLLAIGVFNLVRYLVGRKKRHVLELRFQMLKKAVLRVNVEGAVPGQVEKVVDDGIALSRKIDEHTGRKNFMVLPILVHRIATRLEVGEQKAAIYFCSSFYYDVGLLDVPGELFYSEILTRKERSRFRTHVLCFDNRIAFLPAWVYRESYNACMFHHENCNGTGYPEGLSGTDIPLVARIIRVVESYLSLISRGTYHRGLSKRRAIEDLRRQVEVYDKRIVDILETLV